MLNLTCRTISLLARLTLILAITGTPQAHAETVNTPTDSLTDTFADTLTDTLTDTISAIESEDGEHAAALYPALRQLGLALQARGEHEAAIEPFRRMQALVHRERGVRSTLQADSIEQIIRSYVALGDLQRADQQHEFLYTLFTAAYPTDSDQLLAARWRLATWYRSSFRYNQALALYAESRDQLQNNKPELQRLLRAEALTMFLAGHCCAITKLQQAADLFESEQSFSSLEDYQKLHLDYADALMLDQDPDAAQSIYQTMGQTRQAALLGFNSARAVKLAEHQARPDYNPHTQIISGRQLGRDWIATTRAEPLPNTIGEPVALCAAALAADYNRQQFAEYFVDIHINVDSEGRVQDLRLQGNAPSYLVRYLKTALENSRYRPGISNTGAMVADSISFRQTFSSGDAQPLKDDINGWSSLLTRRTCTRIDSGQLATASR
jgi:tetratricopeptide (TPR) repeat protein